ncbi:MAG: hypothetical protein R3231_09685 [bacterium]|nr:hypothetical protein [bacterium]
MRVKTSADHLILLIVPGFLLPHNYGGCVPIFSSGDGDDDGTFVATTDDGQERITDGFIIIVNQASIGAENAKVLTGLTVKSDPIRLKSEQAALSAPSAACPSTTYRPLGFAFGLGYARRHITLSPTLFISRKNETTKEGGTVDGSCGGFFSYSLNLDRPSEQFDGMLSFADYCDGGFRQFFLLSEQAQ